MNPQSGITSYKVINAPHLRTLEALVNKNILEGWEPIGGVSATQTMQSVEPVMTLMSDGSIQPCSDPIPSERIWTQAMVSPKSLRTA